MGNSSSSSNNNAGHGGTVSRSDRILVTTLNAAMAVVTVGTVHYS